MSGQLIGNLILWLIVAVIVIAIIYWVMNWLYRRSTKEVAFVRTGFLGEKVVIDGGAFVWPIIHDITPVNMNTLQLEVIREKDDALITKDRMRVDVEAEFYVRVAPNRDAVSIAAATLGRRTLEQERLHALMSGKFVSALRSTAAQMTIEEIHEQRGDYVARVKTAAQEALAQNGLELESVAITDIDQTDLEYFNPSNRFDAEGLTKLIEDIEDRRKLRNDIEQDSMIKIRARNLEAEKEALAIERESETARLDQEREVEFRRAAQRAELARERAERETDAENAQIVAREEIEKARIANEHAISEARIASEREIRQKEIERQQTVDAAEIASREAARESSASRRSRRHSGSAHRASRRIVRPAVQRNRTSENAIRRGRDFFAARKSTEAARIEPRKARCRRKRRSASEQSRRAAARNRAASSSVEHCPDRRA